MKTLSVTTHAEIVNLLKQFEALGLDVIKTENLYMFDGKPGYSLAQGQ
jgi:isocitrate dehydrogenase